MWALAYHTTIASILSQWLENGTYSHGLLSLALALYICVHQWHEVRLNERIPWLVLVLVVGASVGWWLASVANVIKVQQLGVYVLLVLTLVATFGWRALRVFRYPLLILLLVIPVWDFMLVPLQDLATIVSFQAVRLLNVPALLEGHQITMPGGRFIVEEACSGLGFLLCAITLGIFYTYMNALRTAQWVALLVIGAATAILANWIRILSILLVGNSFGMDHPVVTDHLTFGWIVFAVALVPYFLVCHYLFPPQDEATVAITTSTVPAATMPVTKYALVAAVCIGLAAMPLAALVIERPGSAAGEVALPAHFEEGTVRLDSGVAWEVEFPGASQIVQGRYRGDQGEFFVVYVTFDDQEQGRELININNRLYAQSWNEIGEDVVQVGDSGDQSVRVKTLQQGSRQRELVYWYVVGGIATSHPVVAKALEVFSVISGNRRASLIAVIHEGNGLSRSELSRDVVVPIYEWSMASGT